MKLLILALILSGCSPQKDNNELPRYSDMSAAADAGQVKP